MSLPQSPQSFGSLDVANAFGCQQPCHDVTNIHSFAETPIIHMDARRFGGKQYPRCFIAILIPFDTIDLNSATLCTSFLIRYLFYGTHVHVFYGRKLSALDFSPQVTIHTRPLLDGIR
jgi:hypothetical protein